MKGVTFLWAVISNETFRTAQKISPNIQIIFAICHKMSKTGISQGDKEVQH